MKEMAKAFRTGSAARGCWKNTRMPVAAIFRNLEAGSDIAEIVDQFQRTDNFLAADVLVCKHHVKPGCFGLGNRSPRIVQQPDAELASRNQKTSGNSA